jgi:glutathione S-transferase
MDEGKLSEEEIRQQIEGGVVKLKEFLTLVESLMSPDGFAFGEHPSWADFFLFPLMADLRALHEWKIVDRRLNDWMGKMDELPAVKETTLGTLAVGARP